MYRFNKFFFIFFAILFTRAHAQVNQPESFAKGSNLYQHSRVFNKKSNLIYYESLAPFYHGVASGDPQDDRVIIWTRVTPKELSNNRINVKYEVSKSVSFSSLIKSGYISTSPDRDYTVKIDVDGLEPGNTYYYRFEAFGKKSMIGKTKTTPTGQSANHLKFAVASCANYQAGYFNNYGIIARKKDLDAVVHLGDYIYEYGNSEYGSDSIMDDRIFEPYGEIVSEEDYRMRYSTYRLDTNLIRLHQQHPIICVWDDHESANDAYKDGAENHTDSTEGNWIGRKNVAKKVYFEWMPIRENFNRSIYRSIQYGDLANLIMLDTRLEGREEQINDVNDSNLYKTDRTLLGKDQKNWLKNELIKQECKWNIIAQQVIFSPLNVGWAYLQDNSLTYNQYESLFLDIWDGYPAERDELIDYIRTNKLNNTVILSGDFHSSFAFDVHENPTNLFFNSGFPFYVPSGYDAATGLGSVAVEFTTPSITSANFDENVGAASAAGFQTFINNPIVFPGLPSLGNPNPHIKFTDLINHGFFILDVKEDSVQANFYYADILEPTLVSKFGTALSTKTGENHLTISQMESNPKTQLDAPAPFNEFSNEVVGIEDNNTVKILGLYPNPATNVVQILFGLNSNTDVDIYLINSMGIEVKIKEYTKLSTGLFSKRLDISNYPAGSYFLKVVTPNGKTVSKLLIY